MLLQQIQDLTSERAGLQGENARLKKQVDDLTKDRDQLKSAQRANDQRVRNDAAALAQSSAQQAADQKDLQLYKQRMQELVDKFRETIDTLRRTEIERAGLTDAVAARDREVKVCMDHNQALYKLNQEVLTRWEKQSLWSRLARSEPFTGIAQTRLENLSDAYRARAGEQRLTPESLKAAAAALPPAPPQPAAPAVIKPPAPTAPPAPASGQSTPAQ